VTRLITLAIALALLLSSCSRASSGPKTYSGTYLSLGDSIAAGTGASNPAATSFVALLAHDEGGLSLTNLAVPGIATDQVIDNQLPQALADRPPVAFITISAGINDLTPLLHNPGCGQAPLPSSCPLDETLTHVEQNFDKILKTLRDAYPDAPIVLLLYPNLYSGTDSPLDGPAQNVVPRLDDVLARVAARYEHTAVATTAADFDGRGNQLTHILEPGHDSHPNDAGHRLIADAFIAALERVK
jgi:lysophospholipase L1-like esterase